MLQPQQLFQVNREPGKCKKARSEYYRGEVIPTRETNANSIRAENSIFIVNVGNDFEEVETIRLMAKVARP